jgi:hypothetical protein
MLGFVGRARAKKNCAFSSSLALSPLAFFSSLFIEAFKDTFL